MKASHQEENFQLNSNNLSVIYIQSVCFLKKGDLSIYLGLVGYQDRRQSYVV